MNDQLLLDILAELRQIRAALGNTSRSSVELSENAKGAVQITVKAYSESPIDTACIEASSGFATMKREVDRGQMTQWAETVADLQAKRAAEHKRIYGSEADGSVKYDLPA
jgi:hypothetical protein